MKFVKFSSIYKNDTVHPEFGMVDTKTTRELYS